MSALIQKVANVATSGSSVSASFASNVTAGSTLVVFCLNPSGGSVSDTLGNTYTSVNGGIWYALNSPGGANTVTVNYGSSAGSWMPMVASEFTAASSGGGLDQKLYASGNSSTPSGSITTTVNGELIVGYCTNGLGDAAGSGFTLIDNTTGDSAEYAVQSSAGTISVPFTQSSSAAWYLFVASFKPATAQSLSATGIPSAEAFGNPTQTPGAVTFTATGIASGEAFGNPTQSEGNAALTATGIPSAEAFGSASLAAIATFTASGIPSAEAFGNPTQSEGVATLAATGIASAEAFGAPSTSATVAVSLTGIVSGEAFGSNPAFGGNATLTATGIASSEAFGISTLGFLLTAATGIPSAEAFGVVSLVGAAAFTATGIGSAEAFGSSTFTPTLQYNPTGIPSAETFGNPNLGATVALTATGIASSEAFGSASLAATAAFSAAGIPSAEAFGTFLVARQFPLSGIPSAEAFGNPTLGAAITLAATGIPSAEAFGYPTTRAIAFERVITYPNGQVSTLIGITSTALSNLLQTLTCQALGIDPSSVPTAYSQVRVGWPTDGAPGFAITDDVCFIRVTEEDVPAINRQRDRTTSQVDGVTIAETYTYTRVWRVTWSAYGPTSFDNIRLIKSALMQLDFVHDALATQNLYLVTDIPASTRAPENFAGRWWDRTDVTVQLNELVTESLTNSIVSSAEVLLFTDRGLVADFQNP